MTGEGFAVVEWVGTVAAVLTTSAFVPQAILILRTRRVEGISLGMYSTFTVGVALWLVYGWMLTAWPVILANAVTLILSSIILATKLSVERRLRRERAEREERRRVFSAKSR